MTKIMKLSWREGTRRGMLRRKKLKVYFNIESLTYLLDIQVEIPNTQSDIQM